MPRDCRKLVGGKTISEFLPPIGIAHSLKSLRQGGRCGRSESSSSVLPSAPFQARFRSPRLPRDSSIEGPESRRTWPRQRSAGRSHHRGAQGIPRGPRHPLHRVDLFEARTAADGPGISLRKAHCLLKATGARIQLVPGAVGEALSRIANGVSQVDVLVISGCTRPEQLSQAWFFLPRMIHARTQVFQETLSGDGSTAMRLLAAQEVAQLAAQGRSSGGIGAGQSAAALRYGGIH